MQRRLFSKWGLVAIAALAIMAGALSNRLVAQAQGAAPQTFVVQAGALGPAGVEVLAFAPASLQIHQGDTVTWSINSFHNIHFEQQPVDLVIAPPDASGQPQPQINPAIAFRTIDTGSDYTGGDATSGLPLQPSDAIFSLIMNLPPGTYSYFCDVHPGMVGVITVVANDTAVPSPADDELQGSMEFASTIGAAQAAAAQLEVQTSTPGQVQAGNGDTGRATVNQFFPFVTTVKAGDSVTFTIPDSSVEGHTVSWPPTRNQDVAPIPSQAGPPVLALGPTIAPMTPSGTAVKPGDAFSSGLLLPGQSFTLSFTDPGVYPFVCNIHPGMGGVIVVQPNT